jgi:hypothetical protein
MIALTLIAMMVAYDQCASSSFLSAYLSAIPICYTFFGLPTDSPSPRNR